VATIPRVCKISIKDFKPSTMPVLGAPLVEVSIQARITLEMQAGCRCKILEGWVAWLSQAKLSQRKIGETLINNLILVKG